MDNTRELLTTAIVKSRFDAFREALIAACEIQAPGRLNHVYCPVEKRAEIMSEYDEMTTEAATRVIAAYQDQVDKNAAQQH